MRKCKDEDSNSDSKDPHIPPYNLMIFSSKKNKIFLGLQIITKVQHLYATKREFVLLETQFHI